MQEIAVVESRIVGGAVFRDDGAGHENGAGRENGAGQMSAGLADFGAFEGAQRPSRAGRASGRVTLRFRVGAETRRYYRWLERLFERHRPAPVSLLHFLCAALIEAWRHTLGSDGAYAAVYERDRYRCTSPVCGQRDVTPHHLKFRSAGGDDSAENVASLCVWCHLHGVHGGRLRAAPPASQVKWDIGRPRHTVVRGRRRERSQVPLGAVAR